LKRGKTFHIKAKKRVTVLGIFSNPKIDLVVCLRFFLFVFVLYLCLQVYKRGLECSTNDIVFTFLLLWFLFTEVLLNFSDVFDIIRLLFKWFFWLVCTHFFFFML